MQIAIYTDTNMKLFKELKKKRKKRKSQWSTTEVSAPLEEPALAATAQDVRGWAHGFRPVFTNHERRGLGRTTRLELLDSPVAGC